MNNTTIMICSIILAFIGICFLVAGIILLQNRKKKEINCTSKTYGKVIDIVKQKTSSADRGYTYMWYPVFEYNIGNLNFIKKSIYGNSECKYAIGQDVEIYYNPENYNEYYVKGETIPKILGIVFTIVGTLIIIISVFLAIALIS